MCLIKRLTLILIGLLVVLAPISALAAGASVITSYHVDITVNENNTYDIDETIAQYYIARVHGMYRVIPLNPEVRIELDGSEVVERYHVIVDNIQVDHPFEAYKENGDQVIQIGDPDVYINGGQKYKISFTYDAGDDGFSEFDQFYYNIIGNTWEVPIDDISFRIVMPKEFDASKIGFNAGYEGAYGYNTDALNYTVEGNIIEGTYTQTLNPGEGLSIRIELPEGYYADMRNPQENNQMFVLVCLIITAVIAILFLRFRRKTKPVVTVEFYPPEGMTSADVGYVIDGIAEDRDVVSLLIYWADKGYLEIHEGDAKDDISFHKITDLPEQVNEYEKLMFERLFSTGNVTKLSSLQNSFYETVSATKTRIGYKFDVAGSRVFKKSSIVLQDLVCMLSALPIACMAGYVLYNMFYEAMPTIVIAVIVFFLGYFISARYIRLVNRWQSEKSTKKVGSVVLWIILTALLYGIVSLLCAGGLGILTIIPAACGICMTLMAPFFRKRTQIGLTWFGRILGLKNFINAVELKKLNMLVEEDPSYFYHILPYAYVLGLSDKWAKQFESIAVEPPSWYYGGGWNTFSTIYFTSVVMNSMGRAQASMISRPSSNGPSGGSFSGGGGFSGGGFSGGGFGGGGGGTW
jgi:uncharacterized membrane protein YgcG